MTPREALHRLANAPLIDEDGEPIRVKLLPPLSDAAIEDFARTLPCPLPEEIRELLTYASGIDGVLEGISVTGWQSYEDKELFPFAIDIAGDGTGNFWVVDLTADSTHFGPIYFACHDAPVIVYQCEGLAEFFLEVLKGHTPPCESQLEWVAGSRQFEIWKMNPGLLTQPDALNSEDAALRDFAGTLEPDWLICDLRNARIGDGFSWGRFGPDTELRRDGNRPIFGYRAAPKRSLLRRIFGR